MRDMRDAGRANILRGSKNGMSKLNETIAVQIRGSEDAAKELAKIHGVSLSLVYAIKNRKAWRHA
jgi:hypothetical protein